MKYPHKIGHASSSTCPLEVPLKKTYCPSLGIHNFGSCILNPFCELLQLIWTERSFGCGLQGGLLRIALGTAHIAHPREKRKDGDTRVPSYHWHVGLADIKSLGFSYKCV